MTKDDTERKPKSPDTWQNVLYVVLQSERRTRAIIALLLVFSACLLAILLLIFLLASNGGIWWISGVGAALSMAVGVGIGARTRRTRSKATNSSPIRVRGMSGKVNIRINNLIALSELDEMRDTAFFIKEFRSLEQELQLYYHSIYGEVDANRLVSLGGVIRALEKNSALTSKDIADIRSVIDVRNHLVHYAEPIPDRSKIRDAARKTATLVELVQSVRK